jgi:hypothetical protein
MDLIGKIIRTDAQSFITRTSDEWAGVDARCSLQRRDCDGVFGAGALRAGGRGCDRRAGSFEQR